MPVDQASLVCIDSPSYLSIHSLKPSPFVWLQPIPSDIWREAGWTLGTSPSPPLEEKTDAMAGPADD